MLRVQKHGEEGRKEFFFLGGGGANRVNGKFIKDGKEVVDGRSWQ